MTQPTDAKQHPKRPMRCSDLAKSSAVDDGQRRRRVGHAAFAAVLVLPSSTLAEGAAGTTVNNSPGFLHYAVLLLISLIFAIVPVLLRKRQHDIKQTSVKRVAEHYRVADLMDFVPPEHDARKPRHYYRWFAVPTIVLAIVVALHAWAGIIIFNNSIESEAPIFLSSTLLPDAQNAISYIALTLMAIIGAFLGSFVWAATYIYRRLASYDLTPTTYYQVALRMISGTMVAVAVRHIMPIVFSVGDEELVPLVILAAFVSGYEPSFGVRLLWQWGRKRLKGSAEEEPVARVEKLPVRSIDGISTYIKARLEEFEIDDVQNLATENPITLYARTPFGLPEIVDWIAQAQLYQLLNREKIQALKRIGVRNVFHFRAQALKNTEFIRAKLSEDEPVPVTAGYVRELAYGIEREPAFLFIERLSAAMKQRGRWRIP